MVNPQEKMTLAERTMNLMFSENLVGDPLSPPTKFLMVKNNLPGFPTGVENMRGALQELMGRGCESIHRGSMQGFPNSIKGGEQGVEGESDILLGGFFYQVVGT